MKEQNWKRSTEKVREKASSVNKRYILSVIGAAALLAAGCSTESSAPASNSPSSTNSSASDSSNGTIKVGVLHSLSGTMAISEVAVEKAELLAIDEVNASGGVLGKKLEPVIEDGASDPQTFAEKAKKLIQQDKVAVIFGGWTSASRKAMLPVVEQNNGLLFYPVQYEGLEASPNIFYTGAAPNQQIVPSVEWLLKNKGKKFFLLGSDYVFPRTANKIIKAQLKADGGQTVGEEYTPLGATDYSTIISKIKSVRPDAIYNTLNGDSNVAFFKQMRDAGLNTPTMSVSIAEQEVKGIGADIMKGQLVAWNYYQTTDTPENKKFVANYKAKYGADAVTDDPIEAGYDAVHLWALMANKAKSVEVGEVKKVDGDVSFNAPEGTVKFDQTNQHMYKVTRIGEVQSDGMIKELWNSGSPVQPDPFLKSYTWAAGLSPRK